MDTKVNLKDYITNVIAEKHDMTKSKAKELVEGVFKALITKISEEEKVFLPGLGTFNIKERAAREGRNPQTQEKIQIEARKVLSFSPAKSLKDKVNE